MGRVLRREAANRDLIAQWVWYAENADIDLADRFLAVAEKTLDLLATQPQIGAPVITSKPELRGIRRFSLSDGFEKVLLFYFPLKDGVDLVRLVYGTRDLNNLLGIEAG